MNYTGLKLRFDMFPGVEIVWITNDATSKISEANRLFMVISIVH